MEAGKKYTDEMGRYPVIMISLKSMKQDSFQDAFYCLKEEIAREFQRHIRVKEKLEAAELQEKFQRLAVGKAKSEEYRQNACREGRSFCKAGNRSPDRRRDDQKAGA